MAVVITTREAAQRLGVHASRVRALIAAGNLAATRAGNQWLVDADSLDRQADLVAAGATGRPFAPRIAWAAAALCDDLADGISSAERHRLRNRLVHATASTVDTCALVRRWLSRRAQSLHRYRIGERDLVELLEARGVTPTGISAADTYNLGLATGGAADAYVSEHTRRELEKTYVLIDSVRGNLTLRVTDAAIADLTKAPRLIAGVDLADDTDARTHAAGCRLISEALRGIQGT
ncbi:excisionase family DNA-binding protein [Mycobacterium sp. Root135]|uniref:excisionase family DNA-binding protein n=1 Tax=Mycobacterium sp. Root135 TaxID=1736457 RepID=UPI0012EA2380|nr:helix-turn-helix domain-containing protein [Mycobacterium sp. Root135]